MKTFRHLSAALLAGAALLASGVVLAHGGAIAKHGGIAKEADDVGYELVVKADGADLYIEDHDAPVESAKLTGKLTVLAAGAKTEAKLTPAGGNRLTATGVKIASGAKVVASVTSPDGATKAVRFAVP